MGFYGVARLALIKKMLMRQNRYKTIQPISEVELQLICDYLTKVTLALCTV